VAGYLENFQEAIAGHRVDHELGSHLVGYAVRDGNLGIRSQVNAHLAPLEDQCNGILGRKAFPGGI